MIKKNEIEKSEKEPEERKKGNKTKKTPGARTFFINA
jgi:hypothetical protein